MLPAWVLMAISGGLGLVFLIGSIAKGDPTGLGFAGLMFLCCGIIYLAAWVKSKNGW